MFEIMTPLTVRLTVSKLLEQRKMSTAEFAEKAGLAYNTALAIRRGVHSRVDLDTIGRVCEALNVKPGELFEVEQKEP